ASCLSSLSALLHPPSTTLTPVSLSSFVRYPDLAPLHSFPTRRSSDLDRALDRLAGQGLGHHVEGGLAEERVVLGDEAQLAVGERSEEHTSELQSRFDLVCRLLLEKKKHILFNYHLRAYLLTRGLSLYY